MTNSNLSCIPFYRVPDDFRIPWQSSGNYVLGTKCHYELKGYRCISNVATMGVPPSESADWELVSEFCEQDFRKWYAYGEKFINRMPSDYLSPFFIVLPKVDTSASWEISSIEFYKVCCKDERVTGLGSFNSAFSVSFSTDSEGYDATMRTNGLSIDTYSDYGILTYLARPLGVLNLPKGMYYIKFNLYRAGRPYVFYSDIFTAEPRADLSRFVKVEWYNMEDMEFEGGRIPYEKHFGDIYFKNELYLDTEIGRPTYNFTEEGEERNGYFFPTKQLSEKVYNMGFVAPEYLCDVMRTIRMADVVRIVDRLGREYKVDQFEMDVDWLEQGHYASVDCSFQTDTILKKVGKSYNTIRL